MAVLTLADITTRQMVPDLLTIAGEWRPDLIVREGMEYGGCLVAERLGIPHASVAGNAYAALDSPEINYFPGNRLMVAEPLARHRERLGLPPDPEVRMPFRHLHLAFTPPAWDGASVARPDNIRFLRHTSTVPPGAQLPDWVEQLPDRPTVFASLGTVFNKTPGVLEAIVTALAEEPANVIVAIGRDQDPTRFGPQPDHIHLEAYLPQPLLLAHCDAFLTHGGFNSVKEALGAGVPMVVVPISADQPYSAERSAAIGVARTVGAGDRTPDAIRDAVRQVLADPGYRTGARGFQAEMTALPDPTKWLRCSSGWRVNARPADDTRCSSPQLPLDLVEPVAVGLDDAARQAVVEEQVALAAGDRGGDGLGGVESGGDVGDLLAQRQEAVEHRLLADEVGGEQADDRLVLDAGEAGRLLHPVGERLAALVGERVVGALARPARLLARAQVAERLEALRLGVPLAVGGVPVDPARPRHADEVVRARAALPDERQDDVREGCQRLV